MENDILKQLEDLKKEKSPIYLSSNGTTITVQCLLKKIDQDKITIKNNISYELVKDFFNGDSYSLQCGLFKFHSKKLESDGKNIVFPMTESNLISDTRAVKRFTFGINEKIQSEILNPFDCQTRLYKSVLDMSESGISIKTPFASKVFQPGIKLPQIQILINRQPYSTAAGEVIYTRQIYTLQKKIEVQVGIKFIGNHHAS